MQYIGGKQKSGAQHIAAWIARVAESVGTSLIIEPFCGGLSVTQRLGEFLVEARDACVPLITLYQALQQGWVPPEFVSRDTWERYRASPDPTDPMTAFCGFGCSRSGAWFSSFVSDYKYTARVVPAAFAARQSLLKKLRGCANVSFTAGDYTDAPQAGVWYCDIPYVDTLEYAAVAPFDHEKFWRFVETLAVPVIVSERQAPPPFVQIAEWSIQSRLNTGCNARRFERLFMHPQWVTCLDPGAS